jgi:hypothetical protein
VKEPCSEHFDRIDPTVPQTDPPTRAEQARNRAPGEADGWAVSSWALPFCRRR